jgi:hypothetical protein
LYRVFLFGAIPSRQPAASTAPSTSLFPIIVTGNFVSIDPMKSTGD